MAKSIRRVALVTGANRGLGFETSRQLLRNGLRVVMSGRDADATERARGSLGELDAEAMSVQLDVSDRSSIDAALRSVYATFGEIDVLVNNAAILLHEDGEVLAVPREAYFESFEVNVLGAIEMCRAIVPAMARRGYGRVVNVSSGAGQVSKSSTYAPAYSLSKAALNAFTRMLAETYRGRGVLVNAVDPGWIRTDMGGSAAPRSVEQGAEGIVWLATLPDSGPTGGFFRDHQPIAW